MFNFNAYCFCPEIISERISDSLFFVDVILPSTVNSDHHVLLDSDEALWLSYMESAKKNLDAFNNLELWRKALDQKRNKILLSKINGGAIVNSKLVSDVAVQAPITCRKFVVAAEVEPYSDQIGRFKSHGVDLLTESNLLSSSKVKAETVRYNHSSFYSHLLSALAMVSSTRANKLEDEHNDYLRDLLTIKGYNVFDQARYGKSETGLRVGNLDLLVKEDGAWATIIEAVRLNCVDQNNIVGHYNKLIDNYNPLRIFQTHLVVYYTGDSVHFPEFCTRYFEFLSSIEPDSFKGRFELIGSNEKETGCQSIRSVVYRGKIDGVDFQCAHTCLCFT